MQISRGQNFKQMPMNIVGSSTFGRYPKISVEKTYNMFMSDNFMVPYSGYVAITDIHGQVISLGDRGRALFTSNVFNKMIAVVDNIVYAIDIVFSPNMNKQYHFNAVQVGTLDTFTSDVYIAENNAGQIAIVDGSNVYIYAPNAITTFQKITTDFIPGYITFHDTYFIAPATGTNQWRLSAQNDGTSWPSASANVGTIESKPDNAVAVTRFPSKGNLIYVMGATVAEAWFDVGYQLFPYQRNANYNIDYGCLNAASVAATDEILVWLAQNEKAGPIIVYSQGSAIEKITSDGIDYLLSQLTAPQDSEGFIFRQDGHLFYHINFYTDNFSLFYDFNTQKFYYATDEDMNYFIAKDVAFFNNQYYFVTRNNGQIYAFDTIYTTYDGKVIPRIRVCGHVREPTQEMFVVNDVGFTVEQGTTNYQVQDLGNINIITEDGNPLITEGSAVFLTTQDNEFLITEDNNFLISQANDNSFEYLVMQQDNILQNTPRIDMSYSIDGGESFGNFVPYIMNPIGVRKNQLRWWNQGLCNDFVPQFRFYGIGRFVATDGYVNMRV